MPDFQAEAEFLVFGAAAATTATTYRLTSADGATSLLVTGTGFTYSGGVPTGGTITSVAHVVTVTDAPVFTITNINVSMADLGALLNDILGVRSQITWLAQIGEGDLVIATSTQIRIANLDGTFTDFIGAGFPVPPNGPLVGNVTAIRNVAADGTTILTQININETLGVAAGAVFEDLASDQLFILLNTGANTVTGGGPISISGTNYYGPMYDGAGNDTINGGGPTGTTYVEFEHNTLGGTINLASGVATFGADTNTLTGILGVGGTEFSDTITGNDSDNQLAGWGGDDTISGAGGNDTISGNEGNDVLDGGAGFDTVSYRDGDVEGGVTVSLLIAGAQNTIGAGTDTLSGFENIEGTNYADILIGSGVGNVLIGNDGADIIAPLTGVDIVFGGSGDDIVAIGLMNSGETLDGGPDTDTLRVLDSPVDPVYEVATSHLDTANLTSFERVEFFSTATTFAVFLTSQIGSGLSTNATIVGGAAQDFLILRMAGAGTFDLDATTNFTLQSWTAGTDIIAVFGSGGADTINGTNDGEYLNGEFDGVVGFGNDIINGLGGNDVLEGWEGVDQLHGGEGDDLLTGWRAEWTGGEIIDGGNGTDTLGVGTGGSISFAASTITSIEALDLTKDEESLGGDVVFGAAQLGGAGLSSALAVTSMTTADDHIIITGAAAVAVDLSGWTFTDWTAPTSFSASLGVLTNLDNDLIIIDGSGVADAVTGSSQSDLINGNAGNDVVHGGDGVDFIDGSTGQDQIYGDGGNDLLNVYVGEAVAGEIVDGGLGTDTLSLEGGDIDVSGFTLTSLESVRLAQYTGAETTLVGRFSAAQVASGLSSSLLLIGSAATDRFVINAASAANLNLSGWTFQSWSAGDHIEFNGSSGDDVVVASSGNDVLTGNGGADALDGGAGADAMVGGAGNDTYAVDNALDTVTENASEGVDTVQSAITFTLASNFENLTLTGLGSTNGTGNELTNVVTGNGAANILNGKAGNDTVDAGGGADTLYGGDGDDVLNGGGDADLLDAGNNNDTLNGGDGVDTLYGRAGIDTLDGGLGADTMFGGAGDDTYVVDDAGDVVGESASAGTDTIQSSVTRALGQYQENLTLTGVAAINGTGNILANVITGNGAANVLSGAAGLDTLNGAGGNDTLNGGNGNDTLNGGADDDILDGGNDLDTLNGGDGIDTLYGRTSNDTLNGDAGADTLYGGDGDDTMSGGTDNDLLDGGNHNDTLNGGDGTDTLYGRQNNDTLNGDAGTDTLYGGDGDDSLNGGADADFLDAGNGADTLDGGLGADTLIGGAGADAFVFSTALGGGNVDSIVGFNVADDVIRLDIGLFTAIGAGVLDADAFVIGSAAADAEDRIVYDSATGALSYDSDGNGAGAAVQFATLATGLALTNADFLGFGP